MQSTVKRGGSLLRVSADGASRRKSKAVCMTTNLPKWFSRFHLPSAPVDRQYEPKEPVLNPSVPCERTTVLAITSSSQYHRTLETIAKSQGWSFLCAGTWAEALRVIKNHEAGVVLLDRGRLGRDWRDALRFLLQPAHRCCVILMTPSTTDLLCREFIREGGYHVVKEPLNESEVIQAVRLAWAFWKTCLVRAYRY